MKIEIPYSDYLTRVERTQAAMKESGVDAILAFSHLSEPTADIMPIFSLLLKLRGFGSRQLVQQCF